MTTLYRATYGWFEEGIEGQRGGCTREFDAEADDSAYRTALSKVEVGHPYLYERLIDLERFDGACWVNAMPARGTN